MTNPTVQSRTTALFEEHNRRVNQLNERRQAVQVQLETARQQYDLAVADAKAAFGTADLDELRAKLAAAEQANAKAVSDFITALDTFEELVARMEKALSDPEALQEMLLELGRTAPAAAVHAPSTPATAASAEPQVTYDPGEI